MPDDLIDAAVAEGKIIPARAEHYRTLMEHDPEGTAELLARLAPVLPVGELGSAVLPGERQLNASSATAGDAAYPREWLADHEKPKQGPGTITFAEY